MANNDMFNEPGYGYTGEMREPIGVYTAKTFGWMALGLVVTFAVAFFIDVTPLVFILYGNGILPFILLIAELIVVGVLSARVHSLSVGGARALFFLYAIINGVTFAGVFFLYDLNMVIFAFGIAALYFGVLAAYGYITKRDPHAPGGRCLFAGLIFLAVFWLLSLFLPLSGFERIVCLIGLVIFMGLTAYDTQENQALLRELRRRERDGAQILHHQRAGAVSRLFEHLPVYPAPAGAPPRLTAKMRRAPFAKGARGFCLDAKKTDARFPRASAFL